MRFKITFFFKGLGSICMKNKIFWIKFNYAIKKIEQNYAMKC